MPSMLPLNLRVSILNYCPDNKTQINLVLLLSIVVIENFDYILTGTDLKSSRSHETSSGHKY